MTTTAAGKGNAIRFSSAVAEVADRIAMLSGLPLWGIEVTGHDFGRMTVSVPARRGDVHELAAALGLTRPIRRRGGMLIGYCDDTGPDYDLEVWGSLEQPWEGEAS